MIKLSYNSTLYSYDGNTETAITNASELGIEIHSQTDLSSSQLVYEQESMGAQSVPIVNNQATIQGINLKSGPLTLYLQIGGKLSNGFTVHITKLATPSGLMDDDPVFTVDRDRRIITIPDTQAIMAVVRDTNSEIIKFKFPRYADGVDLSTKTAYVNFVNATGNAYKSLLSTPQADEGYVFVEWVVGEMVTTQEGVVLFQVEFYGTNYRWQTQIAQLKVVKSLEAQAAEPLQDQTLLEEYLDRFNRLIADGITPTIGDNGNWYIGSTDTGKPSRGDTGSAGASGADGKSAYQYAVEGGYTGTETEFAKKLASEALTVHVTDNSGTLSADKSYSDILNAIHAGISVFVEYNGNTSPLMGVTVDAIVFGQTQGVNDGQSAWVATVMIVITSADEVVDFSANVEALPNPQAITFTGAVTGSYDGSAPLSVNIPTVPTKTSQLTNDSGYLTLATLPKYGGEVV